MDIQGLDEQEALSLNASLGTNGGAVLTEWLMDRKEAAINYLAFETDVDELYRYQGEIRTVQAMLDLFQAVRDAVIQQETSDG